MTTEETPIGTNLEEPTERMDIVLQLIANAANSGGHGVPLTLLVNGSIVSGWTTSGNEFLNQLTENLGQGSAERTQAMREGFSDLYSLYSDKPQVPRDRLPSLLHLKDVLIIQAGSGHAIQKQICRIRISSVSGFSFGAARDSKHP